MSTIVTNDILEAHDVHNMNILQVWKQNRKIHNMDNFNGMIFYKWVIWE
jgi:hypothetical protein